MPYVTESGDQASSVDPKGARRRDALSSWRLELLLSALILGGICSILFVAFIKPELEHQDWHCRVRDSIRSLARKTPPGVSRERWAQAVDWTLNAHANCCGRPEYLKERDPAELRRFADELERRLRGPVDVKTIDWIWDEFERISKYGKTYSDEWRPGRGVHSFGRLG